MTNDDVTIPAAIMSLLRGTDSVRGISERLGVTEAQVHHWKDIFFAAGVLAVYEARHGVRRSAKTPFEPMPLTETTTTTFIPPTPEPTTQPPTTQPATINVAAEVQTPRRASRRSRGR